MADLKNATERKNSDTESDDDNDDNGFSTFTPVPFHERVRTAAQIKEEASIISSSLAAVTVAIRQQREESARRRKEEQQKNAQRTRCCINVSSLWEAYATWIVMCGLVIFLVFGCGILYVAPYADRLPEWLSLNRETTPDGFIPSAWNGFINYTVCVLEKSTLPILNFICVCIKLSLVGVSAVTFWMVPEPPFLDYMIARNSPGYTPREDAIFKKKVVGWWTPIRVGAVGVLLTCVYASEYFKASAYQYQPQKPYCPSSKTSAIAASLNETEKDAALKMADEIERLAAANHLSATAVDHNATAVNLTLTSANNSIPLTNSTLLATSIPNLTAKELEAVNVVIEDRKHLTSNAVSCLTLTATDLYFVYRLPLRGNRAVVFDVAAIGAQSLHCYAHVIRASYRDPFYGKGGWMEWMMDILEYPLIASRVFRHGYGGYTHWSEAKFESIKEFLSSIPGKARKAWEIVSVTMETLYEATSFAAREVAKDYASKRPHLSMPDLPWYIQWASTF
jgi:hypothetical protein